MPAYVEQADDQFNYETEWLEVAENSERGSSHFADQEHEDTLFGYVPWNKRRSAMRFFKGFAYADTASPWRLHREQPHRHPDFPWLRAFDVGFSGTVLQANDENPNSEPYDTTVFTVDPITRRTKFTHALLGVKYRAFRNMQFLTEDLIPTADKEWLRHTLLLPPEANVEALTVTGGLSQLTFSEGGGAPAPTAGTTRFAAPLAELQTKVAFRLLWMHVPWEYLSSSTTFFWPQKLLDRIGRVNSDTFLDKFEPETIRMLPFQVELFPWWVPSDDLDKPLIGCNVTLNFEWFDPPTGITAPFRKGWNNMPWGGDGKVNGDGRYYRATRDGTNAGRGLLEAKDFAPMFSHVSS